MTSEEVQRIERIEGHHTFIKEKLLDVDAKVKGIYSAVIGDKLMGSIGIAERLCELEDNIHENKKEIENLKKQAIKNEVYMNQFIWAFSAIGGFIIIYFFKERFMK